MPTIEELTPEEQLRLAQAAGAIPVRLRPSEVRQRRAGRKNGKATPEPLIKDLPPLPDNVTIHHVPLDKAEISYEDREYDDDEEMEQIRERQFTGDERPIDFADEIFNVIMYLIPYSTFFLLLDILSHKQYSQNPSFDDYAIRLLQAVPLIAVLTFYANRYEKHWITNPLLMTTSILAGSRLVWLMNKANWRMVTEQAPPVGALWVFAIVQMPVGRAVITLLVVLLWGWHSKMRLFPSS
ncbi:hypothetical protein NliqN6_0416 [Naganishia liquefaciens]|uniref:DUF7719 domain-containing protein n=1 Tax=Naganishia liquefaciens TaxID=104408 RepID=A0A8H3TNC0_9TREE|nr:hypothetical protein NliqN6_0416 [Naganishia liquefaciens]